MLTQAQLQTLRAAIDANPTWAAYPHSGDGYYDLARAMNTEDSPAFYVWSTSADVAAVRAAVVWANLTPADAPDGTQAWANRSLQCQGKQFNLQMIVPFAGTINGADANLRAGLQDALTGIRSAAGGASQGAGWAAVAQALTRKAKYAEKALADTSSGNGGAKNTPATLTFEGDVTAEDIQAARSL